MPKVWLCSMMECDQAIERLSMLIKNHGGGVEGKTTADPNVGATAIETTELHRQLSLNAVPVHDKFSPANSFVFYAKTFLLANLPMNGNTEECDATSCQLQELTAALLYNLGLSYHYAAMNTGKSKYLKTAMKLYTKAYQVMSHNESVLNTSTILLLLEVNNNMGHISSHLADEVAVRIFQNYIKCLLSSSGDCSQMMMMTMMLLRDANTTSSFPR
jgi:hypothetical protein